MASQVAMEMNKRKRIEVRFPYDADDVTLMRRVAGRAWHGDNPNDKYWTIPLDLEVCRQMRDLFGDRLRIGKALRSWASGEVERESKLGSLADAETASLSRLPSALPTLYRALHLGPYLNIYGDQGQQAVAMKGPGSYQVADVQFLASAVAPINGNEMGTGKTPEAIGAVWEAGMEDGAQLVIAPKTAVDGTWDDELHKWHADATKSVSIHICTGSRAQREAVIQEFAESSADVRWVVVNPEMIRYSLDPTRTAPKCIKKRGQAALKACYCNMMKDAHEHYETPYPELMKVKWRTIIKDEVHKGSVRNHRTITAQAMYDLKAEKFIDMSGTPMKKMGQDLWGILHDLRPDVFTSFWNFADLYCDIERNEYGTKVLGIRKDAMDALQRALKPYMLRRLKAEVMPWLPAKHQVDVWCRMEPKQEAAYRAMEEDGFALLASGEVNTTSILAEYTRQRQFASALCTIRDGKVVPTRVSCKLDSMLEKMEEAGVFEDPAVKQVVFSQSREMITLAAEVLAERGVKVEVLHGGINKRGARKALKDDFQAGDIQILCVVTTAGGVSLTLDAADTAHFLDEMWSPDEGSQAEDRLHRASRLHQVTIYHYRTRDTIDEEIMDTALGKAEAHRRILDERRKKVRT